MKREPSGCPLTFIIVFIMIIIISKVKNYISDYKSVARIVTKFLSLNVSCEFLNRIVKL